MKYDDIDKTNWIWDSDMESKVFERLNELIIEDFIILPHMSGIEVFKKQSKFLSDFFYFINESDPKAVSELERQPTLIHYDLAIYDKKAWKLVMLIEINGGKHKHNRQKTMDLFKELLARINRIPLLIFDASQPIPDDKIKDKIKEALLKVLKDNIITDEWPAYCEKCFSRLESNYNNHEGKLFFYCPKCKQNIAGEEKPLSFSYKHIFKEDKRIYVYKEEDNELIFCSEAEKKERDGVVPTSYFRNVQLK